MPAHRTEENQGIVATESRHTVEGMARGERKKKKPPKKKAPNKKRETAACGSACLRAAAPPSSLASFLSSFGGCAASFSCPLRASLSSCGRLRRPSSLLLLSRFLWAAAPPEPFRFSSLLRRLRRLTLPRALVGGWRRPLAPLLHYEIASLRDAHGDRCSSIPRLRKSEIFLSGVIEIEPLRGLFCYRHMS